MPRHRAFGDAAVGRRTDCTMLTSDGSGLRVKRRGGGMYETKGGGDEEGEGRMHIFGF